MDIAKWSYENCGFVCAAYEEHKEDPTGPGGYSGCNPTMCEKSKRCVKPQTDSDRLILKEYNDYRKRLNNAL